MVVLIGLIGGVAMASVAAARRTQSSYPTFLASTNPSDMTFSDYSASTSFPIVDLTARIARLAQVKRVVTTASPLIAPLVPDGAPNFNALGHLAIGGSTDGMFVEQDRVTVVEGRMADPHRSDEIVMTASAAEQLRVRAGQVLPLGFYTNAQEGLPGFGTPSVTPRLRVDATVVGIVILNNEVIEDDIDRSEGFVLLTPALIRQAGALSPAANLPVLYGLQLERGTRDVPAVEREIIRLVPRGSFYNFHVTSRVVAEVELAVKPESIALGAFGGVAGLVCLVLGLQAASRQLHSDDEDRQVLRALGAAPAVTSGDGMIGVLGAVIVGSVVAVAVAVGLSPLAPLGPVRPVYPGSGTALDWTVLGLGFAVLVGALGASAAALAYRGAPHRVARRAPQGPSLSSRLGSLAEKAGGPVAGVVGVRFALEPGRGRTAVPVRSALLGTVLAVSLVVTTLTFASSLNTLVSHPALYGWNWSYTLDPSNDVPPQALRLLDRDPDVSAWAGYNYTNAQVDGQNVPILLSRPGAALSPPVVSGHGLNANDQIVLGAASLALLHKHVGGSVVVTFGSPADAPLYVPPTRFEIVGTATFPAVGYASLIADHTSMGTGALISEGILPPAFQQASHSRDPNLNGPELVFVRLRHGVSAAVGRADMQRIASAANKVFATDPQAGGNNVIVLGVQRPAQIVNYRSIGLTPVALAVGLGVGALVALALTLAASVRRRRRDLALLKALGFTNRQLVAAVATQATVAATVGIVVGIPVGIVIGRQVWTLFANNINAVPDPTVPVLWVVIVALGAIAFANLVAALPGRSAARTPTALVLRAE
jgi:hypothetical protein